MPVNEAGVREKKRPGIPPLFIAVAFLLLFGGVGMWYLQRQSQQPPAPPPPLTAEAREYTKYLGLSNVEMQAHTNSLQQQLVEITGNIQNTGDRKLALVEINCIFYDPYGKVLLRDRVPIVSRRMGGLAPGETKTFRLPFDTIPEDWNQATPQLVIAQIQFQ